MNSLVTFCTELVCYSGYYSAHHPKVPPGIVYGLANGVAENLPLVLYNVNSSTSQHGEYSLYSIAYRALHFFSVSGMFVLGASIFKYLHLSNNISDEEEVCKDTVMDYSKKYYDKYDALCKIQKKEGNNGNDTKEPDVGEKEKKEEEETSKMIKREDKERVIDYTGDQYGNIMMNYNSSKEAFEYFADNKSVPFSYLEAVSRKLVISFHCTNRIIDRRVQGQIGEGDKGENGISDNEEVNRGENRGERGSEKQQRKAKKDPRSISNIIKASSNKFIYVGKFSSVNPLQTLVYDEASPSKRSLRTKFSYKDYIESLKH